MNKNKRNNAVYVCTYMGSTPVTTIRLGDCETRRTILCHHCFWNCNSEPISCKRWRWHGRQKLAGRWRGLTLAGWSVAHRSRVITFDVVGSACSRKPGTSIRVSGTQWLTLSVLRLSIITMKLVSCDLSIRSIHSLKLIMGRNYR